MDAARTEPAKAPAPVSPAALAKGALRRLATERLEPTPENYARAYRQEAGAPEGSSVLPARAQRLVDRLAARALDGDGAEAASPFSRAMAEGQWEKAERALDAAPAAGADALARLIERLVRGVERGGPNWTVARRKLAVQRVLDASRSDTRRLQQRLSQLVASWEGDTAGAAAEGTEGPEAGAGPVDANAAESHGGTAAEAHGSGRLSAAGSAAARADAAVEGSVRRATESSAARRDGLPPALPHALPESLSDAPTDALSASRTRTPGTAASAPASAAQADSMSRAPGAGDAPGSGAVRLLDAASPEGRAVGALSRALQHALPTVAGAPHDLAAALGQQTDRLLASVPWSGVEGIERLSDSAARVLQHRHHLFDELGKLTVELTASLTDLAENDSWVRGQCEAMRMKIEDGLTPRGVRSVSDMLHTTRKRHETLRGERERARGSLKGLINRMLAEVAELGAQTGSFHESVGRYATVIDEADSLESLAGVVREMVEESRTVQTLVHQTQQRLQAEHTKATDLSQRVSHLEGEMKRLSDEVSTDQLTKIANRRGLMATFEVERSRIERSGTSLGIGLLDIDNFKRLNDDLGHAAGDEALKTLAALISRTLRPTDSVARYGGEEFVVLLPATPVDEGVQILTRLQRALTGGLFMHKDKQVFVTFSAGLTAYRPGESIEEALERADQGLYEAKRTGKNRTCTG